MLLIVPSQKKKYFTGKGNNIRHKHQVALLSNMKLRHLSRKTNSKRILKVNFLLNYTSVMLVFRLSILYAAEAAIQMCFAKRLSLKFMRNPLKIPVKIKF